MKNKDYVDLICKALSLMGDCLPSALPAGRQGRIEFEREYKFLKNRKFRFDIAIPKYKIAIEFEGGIFMNGRHTRGWGYANDARKYNLAVLNGWKVLRYTTADTNKKNWHFGVASEVKEFISKGTE